MKIVSIDMIVRLNKQLENENNKAKIHLRDACGSQSMWIEKPDLTEGKEEELITKFFKEEQMELEWKEQIFWVKQN